MTEQRGRRGETSDRSRKLEGPNVSGGEKEGGCVILSIVRLLNPLGSPGAMIGNLAPKAEKDGEEVSHTNVLLANVQDVFCVFESEGENKRGHSS